MQTDSVRIFHLRAKRFDYANAIARGSRDNTCTTPVKALILNVQAYKIHSSLVRRKLARVIISRLRPCVQLSSAAVTSVADFRTKYWSGCRFCSSAGVCWPKVDQSPQWRLLHNIRPPEAQSDRNTALSILANGGR